MKLELDNVCATESGDYYQVSFHADTDDGPCLLVQRQFEGPDGGYCYVETHDEDYRGHVRFKRSILTRDSFVMELRRKQAARIEVRFCTTRTPSMNSVGFSRLCSPTWNSISETLPNDPAFSR